MAKNMNSPDYLFEVSWEVCNKMGGIHTVLSTKAKSVLAQMKSHYMVIGPDVWRDSGKHPEFLEDNDLFSEWRKDAAEEGIIVRAGKWKIDGEPIALLVDFTSFFNKKDEIFSDFWEQYKLDSISGQWDYIEPMLFGYATGKIIESYVSYYGLKKKKWGRPFSRVDDCRRPALSQAKPTPGWNRIHNPCHCGWKIHCRE